MSAAHCPHCGAEAPGLDPRQGLRPIVDCAACDRSFIARLEAEAAGAAPTAGRHPTEVPLLASGAAAAVATLGFYASVVPALAGTMPGALFAERGQVPVAIAFLAAWTIAILARKAWLLRDQRTQRALVEGVLAGNDPIDDSVAVALAARIDGLRQQHPRSLWLTRVASALDHFCARGSAAAVSEHRALAAQSDAAAVDGSYTLVRVFVWAIPILGFIGTVIGIGAAVAGFSDSVAQAVDLDVMKSSIGTVTSGLGIAFDTTLLALVVSVLLMIPTSALQKTEQDWLSEIDAVCDERLLRRMRDREQGPRSSAATDELGRQIERLAQAIDAFASRPG